MTEGIAAGPTAAADSARSHRTPLWRLAPVGVALASLALGLAAAGHRSLTTDEAAALAGANGSFGEVVSRIVHDDPGQAGGLLLARVATSFGRDELTLRVPSAVAVAVAAGLLVVLGTMLLGRLAGLVAGIAFAGSAGVVEASREMRPYALGLLGIVLATLLFVWALERGGGPRWCLYAVAAAVLPLTHPLAASVLLAHGAALAALHDRRTLQRAGVALLAACVVVTPILAWMAADRLDAPDGAGALTAARFWHGVARGVGWNPVIAIGAATGLVALLGPRRPGGAWWRGVLVAGLIAAPAAGTLLASLALPVFPEALVLVAPGSALAAGAAVPLLARDERLLRGGIAVLVVACGVTIAVRLGSAPQEDWRALAAAVGRVRQDGETVVVVPERSRPAFAYYAPAVQTVALARGEGAWVAVAAGSPDAAIAAARPVVQTPRYALLRQFRYGSGLRLQHWVRP